MSKHNYSQYSNKKNNGKVGEAGVSAKAVKPPLVPIDLTPEEIDAPAVKMVVEVNETTAAASVEVEPVETATVTKVEPIETTEATPNIAKGIVAKCVRLNVRAYPSFEAEVVCVLDVMSEVEINTDKSTFDWLCVCTATGVEGYCMKKFVETHL